MLQLTSNAARHLIKLRHDRGVDDRAGVQFTSKEGRVGMTFSLAPMDGDRVVDNESIKVFVAADIATALDQSIIDVRDEDGRTSLIMRKQAATTPKVASPAN